MDKKRELPAGWKWVKTGDVIKTINNGYTPKRPFLSEGFGEVPFIKVYNLNFDGSLNFKKNPTFIPASVHQKDLRRSICYPGDVLINIVGPPLGKVSVVTSQYPEWNINQAIVLFRPNEQVISSYISYFLQNPETINWLESTSKATAGQWNVKVSTCREIPLPLPPLAEQQRIVAKLEELFSELDAGLASLNTAAQQLKTYRQAVLKWAFEGRLTNERVNEGELPARWSWVKLGEKLDFVGSGITPKGGQRVYQTTGVIFIRSQNVYPNQLRLDDVAFISDEIDERMKRTRVAPNDVLLNITGASIGRCAFVPNTFSRANVNQHVCILRTNRDSLLNRYLSNYLNSPKAQAEIMNTQSGATRQGLNFEQVKNLLIPFCSLEEQHRIVQEIESRLSVCDKLEETLAAARKQAEALRQSILKQAFAGKLLGKTIEKPKSIPFYQLQTLGWIVNRSGQQRIQHGEMTIAKYAYLADRLFDVPTYFNYQRGNLGPYPSEIKKTINNREYFRIKNHVIQLQNAERLFKYTHPHQARLEQAIDELTETFSKYDAKDRARKTELLATVCKVIEDVQSLDAPTIRQSMSEWRIDLPTTSHKTKAEKFTEEETINCLAFIVKKGWDKKLLK